MVSNCQSVHVEGSVIVDGWSVTADPSTLTGLSQWLVGGCRSGHSGKERPRDRGACRAGAFFPRRWDRSSASDCGGPEAKDSLFLERARSAGSHPATARLRGRLRKRVPAGPEDRPRPHSKALKPLHHTTSETIPDTHLAVDLRHRHRLERIPHPHPIPRRHRITRTTRHTIWPITPTGHHAGRKTKNLALLRGLVVAPSGIDPLT
ncbi:hypothetical protein BEUL_1084 [Bifidobacterium eulemuris]|uniref:Uncharacterized protein n=1 Tax=Bifidobacterium eulemuris TaxID=1765219 RepID=A0A261GA08_9BIFI|nr:hypothetical protein BEUL_1084 [Bifidobacterium eulemuris]